MFRQRQKAVAAGALTKPARDQKRKKHIFLASLWKVASFRRRTRVPSSSSAPYQSKPLLEETIFGNDAIRDERKKFHRWLLAKFPFIFGYEKQEPWVLFIHNALWHLNTGSGRSQTSFHNAEIIAHPTLNDSRRSLFICFYEWDETVTKAIAKRKDIKLNS